MGNHKRSMKDFIPEKLRTVSWYIHSYQLYYPVINIITLDRECISCSVGTAIQFYGHCRVQSVLLTETCADIILASN